MTSNTYWRLALPCPLRQLFTYRSDTSIELNVGSWVLVPFGNRRVVGLILEPCDQEESEYEIKNLIEEVHHKLALPESLVELMLWTIRYYHAVPWDVVSSFVPKKILSGQPPKTLLLWSYCADGEQQISPRAHRQKELWHWIKDKGPLSKQEILSAGFSGQIFNQLAKAGVIQSAEASERVQKPPTKNPIKREQPALLAATTEQRQIIEQADTFGKRTILLEGVTGSGKTLVYQYLAQRKLAENQQVLILVPEIGLIPQMLVHCRALVDNPFSYHSGMTDTERQKTWLACLSGEAQVVVGTRSALFLPLTKLAIIVLDEEHDSSYKQLEGIRYQARDLAVVRGAKLGIPVVLGTATPSLESFYNIEKSNFAHLQLTQRVAGGEMPQWRILEGRGLEENAGLMPKSLDAIKDHLKRNQQVLVFINRRGYAPCLRCAQCGWQASCDSCDSRYTYHRSFNELRCHRCDVRTALPPQCPICASQQLKPLGQGTERISQRLSEFFPKTPIIRIDRDATRGKEGMRSKLDEVHSVDAAILVGTQMLAKGHHFPRLSLVLILDIDYAMTSADFRATEHSMQLITQVAGRAGREQMGAEVILQTEYANHPMLKDLVANNYQAFAQRLAKERQNLLLPPYSYLAILRAEAQDYQAPYELLNSVSKVLQTNLKGSCQLIGPTPSPTEKRSGRYRFQMQISSEVRSSLHQALSLVTQIFDSKEQSSIIRRKKIRWHIDLDPISLD